MSSFFLDLSKAVERAKGKTQLAVKKIVIDLAQSCIRKSPVDTGRFRGAWTFSAGVYSNSPSGSEDKDGNKTLGSIQASVQSAKISGQSLFITNALPYAVPLEYGHSNKAPGGMVRLSLSEVARAYGGTR